MPIRLATAGPAEKFRNTPIKTKAPISISNVLSTVHHQLPKMLRLFLENVNTSALSRYLIANAGKPASNNISATIQKRSTTVVSGQPHCSK